VNFKVNFNVLLNKYTGCPLVKIKKKDFNNIKMNGTATKKFRFCLRIAVCLQINRLKHYRSNRRPLLNK
jgi:hypothetical protein